MKKHIYFNESTQELKETPINDGGFYYLGEFGEKTVDRIRESIVYCVVSIEWLEVGLMIDKKAKILKDILTFLLDSTRTMEQESIIDLFGGVKYSETLRKFETGIPYRSFKKIFKSEVFVINNSSYSIKNGIIELWAKYDGDRLSRNNYKFKYNNTDHNININPPYGFRVVEKKRNYNNDHGSIALDVIGSYFTTNPVLLNTSSFYQNDLNIALGELITDYSLNVTSKEKTKITLHFKEYVKHVTFPGLIMNEKAKSEIIHDGRIIAIAWDCDNLITRMEIKSW